MTLHKMNIFENAIDSLNEALYKYTLSKQESGNARDLKFAILHASHFVELLMKSYIYEINPLLIYKNPFAKDISKQKTIDIWDAINFIENLEGEDFFDDMYFEFRKNIVWLKGLRNEIEHFEFELDEDQVKVNIGRIIESACSFHKDYSKDSLLEKLDLKNHEVFKSIVDDFEEHKKLALIKANKSTEKYWCFSCALETLIPTGVIDGDKKYLECAMCDTETFVTKCTHCEAEVLEEDCNGGEDEDGFASFICESCLSHWRDG